MLLPRRSEGRALWLPRVSAICGLLAMFAGAAAIVASAGTDHPRLAAADVRFIATRLVDLDERVRGELAALGPQSTLVRARAQTRDGLAKINALARFVGDAGGPEAARARLAIRAERRFLAGIESVLAARGGRLLHRLAQLDIAARQELAGIAGSRPRDGDGVAMLQRRWGAPSATQRTRWMSAELRRSLTTPAPTAALRTGALVACASPASAGPRSSPRLAPVEIPCGPLAVDTRLRAQRSLPGSAAAAVPGARSSAQPRALGAVAVPAEDLQVLRR